ncbi:hypothetical protein G6514_010222 [Epicoccum nigrum]|nr:hypothetical protein G6514_010222 [Epicoccum nigrum]
MSLKHLLNHDDAEQHTTQQLPPIWFEPSTSNEYSHALQGLGWTSFPGEIFNLNAIDKSEWGPDLGAFDSVWVDNVLISDEVTFAEQQPAQGLVEDATDRHVTNTCYGMIYRTAVKLCGDMTELDRNLRSSHEGPIPGHVMLALRQVETGYLVMFTNGAIFGEINAQLHEALTTLSQQAYHLDFEVFAPIGLTRDIISKSIKDKTAIVRVQVNIYGAHVSAKHIGDELSQHRLYLQRPDYLRSGAQYDNPHVLELADFKSEEPQTTLAELGNDPEKAADSELGRVVTDVYASLTRSQKLTRLKGDNRLVTQLLPHQEQALDFMNQRENGPIPDDFRLWKSHDVEGIV